MDRRLILTLSLCFFLLLPAHVFAISASTDRTIYLINENITITGVTGGSGVLNVTATIRSSTSEITSFNTTSSGGTPNDFNLIHLLNESETPAGKYHVIVSDGSDSVTLYFDVVSEMVYLEAHLIDTSEVVNVSTDTLITSNGQLGGNFSDLMSLSISNTLRYGNQTVGAKTYHFVLVDQNLNNTYDTLYIDDDKVFLLYDDAEDSGGSSDLEKQNLREGDKFKDYIIGEIDPGANKMILAKPVPDPVYNGGDTANFIVLAKNVNKSLLSGQYVSVVLYDSGGNSEGTTSGTTNEFGFFVSSFQAPSTPDTYTISLNDSMGIEVFFVESFKLMGKVTDLSGSPSFSFVPGSPVRINVISKDASGTPVGLSSSSVVITYPNGSMTTKSLTQASTGVYYCDLETSNSLTGDYGVKITGTYGGNTQDFYTGFSVEAVKLMGVAMNHEFMDQAEGPGAEINAFAPQKNITIMTMLLNVSAGGMEGMKGGGPGGPPGAEGGGMIDIDNASTASDECSSLVTLVELKDERGVSHLSEVTYDAKNLTNIMSYFGIGGEEEAPPPQMLRQCMLIITSGLNKTGFYHAKIKVTHPLGTKTTGVNFGVQKLLARGATVDFKGEDFGFFGPNTTVRIKLRVTDLSTREELNASRIMDAKIIEMRKEFPGFKELDIKTNISGEGVSNGVLSFLAPNEEGFFTMKFRFKANLTGEPYEEGIGQAFFMLKKYMIWGHVKCDREPCYTGTGENISLKVYVVDIDKGSMLDMGMESGLTCTGCEGLVAGIDGLWNDQIMKEIPDYDYSVIKGVVVNSTATIRISPKVGGIPTGWYGVDIVLNDTETGNTYFGWGGFEVRNFWVDTIPISNIGGNLTAKWEQPTYPKGGEILFGVMPRDPQNPDIIHIPDTISVRSVNWMVSWPPPEVPYNSDMDVKNVTVKMGGAGMETEMMVVNITGLQNEGRHQANVEVTVLGKGTDIGTFWFELASYKVNVNYRGMEDWPPVFSSSENLSVTFTGTEFNESIPHNLSVNGTKLFRIFDEKAGMPKKANYTTGCTANVCEVNVSLSGLSSGRYFAEFRVNDTNGTITTKEAEFMIKDFIVSIPSIEEAWTWERDSSSRELNMNNDRDTCENKKGLDSDAYTDQSETWLGLDDPFPFDLKPDNCSSENTKICLDGGNNNITFGGPISGTLRGNANCVFNNGSLLKGDPTPCQGLGGRIVIAAGNGTHVWFNTSDVNLSATNIYDMSGISPNVKDDQVDTGNRNWTLGNLNQSCGPVMCFKYTDDLLFKSCTGGWNCEGENETIMILSDKNYTAVRGRVFCVTNNWQEDQKCGSDTVYVFSNTSHVWISNQTNLTQVTPEEKGMINVNGNDWYVLDVGRQNNGNSNDDAFRVMPGYAEKIVSIHSGGVNLTVAGKYSFNKGSKWCIDFRGDWNQRPSCNPDETEVYVYSNSTHMWINSTPVLNTSQAFTNDSSVIYNTSVANGLGGKNWTITSVGGSDPGIFTLRHANGKVCGEADVNCTPGGCDRFGYVMIPANSNYTGIYHGYRNLVQNEDIGENMPGFNGTKYVYIYHNTTHVYMSSDGNFSGVAGSGIGDTFTDPYGGKWKVKNILKRVVKLEGVNVLVNTGAYVNTTLSKSGVINIGVLEEEYLGKWGKEGASGLDLDGDGYKNGTLYFALLDNATKGVYDTMIYSKNNNFTNTSAIIPINSDMSTRTFGFNDTVTLLSIDPNANRIKVYSKEVGDWGELGDFKLGSNITIPIIVRTPAGTDTSANVSLPWIKIKTASGVQMVQPSPVPNKSINGLGEIIVNLTELGYSDSGEYMFEMEAEKDGKTESLEEWKWPRVTMRAFLVESYLGEASYLVGNIYAMPIDRYDWETYGSDGIELETVNASGGVIYYEGAVDSTLGELGDPPAECPGGVFEPPAEGIGTVNATFKSNRLDSPRYYYYVNGTGRVWVQTESCNFTFANTTNYTVGDQIDITYKGKTYMTYVLHSNATQAENQGVVIGVAGLNPSTIWPLKVENDGRKRWRMMVLNLSGTVYDVIFASNETGDYPMCDNWGIDECVKMAWFDTDGNFSSGKVPASMGENFTSELYVARFGPGPWEGIIIANFSQLPGGMKPRVDVRVMDNTTSYFRILDESAEGIDFDMDGAKDKTFYAILFDDREDGLQNLTNILVDDDLDITQDGWKNDSVEDPNITDYYDFYGTESGVTMEMWGNLPNAFWSGEMRFGAEKENVSWELQPRWKIADFNSTLDMLVMKDRWQLNDTDNVTFLMRTYSFDQSPMQGTNLTLKSIMQRGPFGAMMLSEGPDYSLINVKNVTGSDGYGIIKTVPVGTWQDGEYMVSITANYTGSVEIINQWFRIGEMEW